MIFGKYGPATARDMERLLGLKGTSQFPAEGMDLRIIQGHEVWVEGKNPYRMTLRTRTCCPRCGKELPVGRLNQHEKKMHPKEHAADYAKCMRQVRVAHGW